MTWAEWGIREPEWADPIPGRARVWQYLNKNKKKKGKKNKDSKKNVSSNVRIDGFENTDANL
jgi:hypothetical protein